jgi:hypothetical protein
MDQVRFELTTSRVTGEVTLPCTTSNLFCLSANSINQRPVAQAFRPEALHSATTKFKPGGINGQSARLTAPLSIGVEVSLFRTIPVSFAAGTLGSRLPNALPAELRQLSLAAGFEPATFGSDVTRAYATPQTF